MNNQEIVQYITDLLTSDKQYFVRSEMDGDQPIKVYQKGKKFTVLGCTTTYTIRKYPDEIECIHQQYGPIGNIIPHRCEKYIVRIGDQTFDNVRIPLRLRRALDAVANTYRDNPRCQKRLAAVLRQR